MIHNPADRIAKMMREIRAFDPQVTWCPSGKFALIRTRLYALYAEHSHPPYPAVFPVAQKPERCLRQALKQVRKIRGKA